MINLLKMVCAGLTGIALCGFAIGVGLIDANSIQGIIYNSALIKVLSNTAILGDALT